MDVGAKKKFFLSFFSFFFFFFFFLPTNNAKNRRVKKPGTRERERERGKNREERTGSHWFTMDPRVEIAFFTSSTFPAENLNTGETEVWVGNWPFSRASFLSYT